MRRHCSNSSFILKIMEEKMNRIYFDTNVFEYIIKKKNISVDELNSFNNVSYYISTAHVEEYFIAIKNDLKKMNIQDNNDRKLLMTSLKHKKGILNPGKRRIINKVESFDDCLSRVQEWDTTDIMISKSKALYKELNKYFRNLISKEPSVKNNSNLDDKEIWNKEEVKTLLAEFSDYLIEHNKYLFTELKPIYGRSFAYEFANKRRVPPFELKKDCFKDISNQYSTMELVFEFLHFTLNKCGYNRDKEEFTVRSGIYDTTHSIYGTYCNYFVSNDNRLRKRVSAIYYYLGVTTKVISFNEFLDIADKLR